MSYKLFCFLIATTLAACQNLPPSPGPLDAEVSSPVPPSASPVLPTPLPEPSEQPSALPSVEPSYAPTPTPEPTPLGKAGEIQYYDLTYCRAITASETQNPVLRSPLDVVVSQDGQTVYATNQREPDEVVRDQSVTRAGTTLFKRLRDRQFVYKLQNGQASIMNIDGNYAHSCFSEGGEIERDGEDQLLLGTVEIEQDTINTSYKPGFITLYKAFAFHGVKVNAEPVVSQVLFRDTDPEVFAAYYAPQRLKSLRYQPDLSPLVFYLSAKQEPFDYDLLRAYDREKVDWAMVMKEGRWNYSVPTFAVLPEDQLRYGMLLFTKPWPVDAEESLNAVSELFRDQAAKDTQGCWNAEAFTDTPFTVSRMRANAEGVVYLTESASHSLWKLSPEGKLSCFAGGGQAGYADGSAQQARFRNPAEIDIDGAGNLYVADTGNHAIRKVTPEGVVSTIYRAPDAR